MAWRACLLIVLSVCTGLISVHADPAPGRERWNHYRDGLLAEPGLVRFYGFEGVTDAQSPVPDLTGAGAPLQYVPGEREDGTQADDMTVIPGRWSGKPAVSLDQAWYEAPPVEATAEGFSVECWFREHGAGTLQPRGPNGTLLSVSSGYYDGWRITLSGRSRSISFAIGRPGPDFSISASCVNPAPQGAWTHLAATWDRRVMRIYLNGVQRAESEFDGDYTPAHVLPLFKVGYAGFGVGSFKLDVDMVALYDRALTPEQISAHANPEGDLEAGLIASLLRGDELVAGDAPDRFDRARERWAQLVAMPDDPNFAPLSNYRVLARLRIADSYTRQGDADRARERYRAIADDETVPEHYRLQAWFALARSLVQQRRYAAARTEYEAILAAVTGKDENSRVEAIERLADIETLQDGAPEVGLRQRRLDRISHPAVTLWVATDGDDANPGARDAPWRTLERARDAVRDLKAAGPLPDGGVAVQLRGGSYRLTSSVRLGAEDSGSESAPVVYRAAPGEQVRLTGAATVTGFGPVEDAAAGARLPEEARDHVLVADLRAQGIEDYGELTPRGYGRPVTPAHMELFYDDAPMELARWPNKSPRMSEGFVPLFDLLLTNKTVFRGDEVEKDLHFVYDGDRPSRWAAEPDVWLYGYWAVEYAAQYQHVKSIDTDRHVIELDPPDPSYGLRKGRPWYALNLLPELDSPGEYYVDRREGRLYFWPPDEQGAGTAVVSMLSEPLVVLDGASHVVLRGLTLEGGRAGGVVIEGGEGDLVAGCTIRNLGNSGVAIKGGRSDGVLGCDIYDVGDGGISMSGGDRATLTPAGHFAENNHIFRFSRWDRAGYRSGIAMAGVGCRAAHNLINDCPHHAINVRQNDHILEYNELHDICYEASEMGCYYIWGGADSFSWRGNVVRFNYFHHLPASNPFPNIRTGGPGLHIDALNGAMTVYGNIFQQVAGTAVFNGGGRDSVIANNIFTACGASIVMGDRQSLFPGFSRPDDMIPALRRLPYQEPPWSVRYPLLVGILEDEPGLPRNNLIERNINIGEFLKRYGAAADAACTIVRDNWDGDDPGFTDPRAADFRISADSPVFGRIGFEQLPVEEIGLYKDELRASWPVEHQVGERRVRDAHWTRREHVPTGIATRRTAQIAIDGRLDPAEWDGLDREQALVLERDPKNREGAGPPSWAWLRYDDEALYVGVLNEVVPDRPLAVGARWGTDDGLEVDIEGQMGYRNRDWWVQENEHGPVFMLVGDTTGQFECLQVGGLPAGPAAAATAATTYGATVVDAAHWSAEWRIPLAAVCVDPEHLDLRAFNIGVRKTAGPADVSDWQPGGGPAGWVVWVGTGGRNWEVWNAGQVQFAP